MDCKYSKYCGNCNLLQIPYEEQLKTKSKMVEGCLRKYNIDINVPDANGAFFPYKYRNKVHLAFKSFKGKTIVGFFEEGSGKIVDIDSCLLHADWLTKLIIILKNYVKKYKIQPYDPLTKTGTIRYAVARVVDNKIMLTLVTTTKNFAGREYLYAKLLENFKSVSFYININKRTDKLVFDENGFDFVKGDKYIESSLLGVKYLIAPNSFLQINLDICKAMYQKTIDWLDIKKEDNILDLYSGIGITSILFAKKCNKVVSIEYNKEATKMASVNQKLNNITNLIIYTGACESVIDRLDIKDINKAFLDPARMGAEDKTLRILNDSNIDRIVYMSCNPETLARDLKILLEKYEIVSIETYDMFPHTNHIETLVCLQKKVSR